MRSYAGKALARIVWSAAARNIATMTPGKTRRNACLVVSAVVAASGIAEGRDAVDSGDSGVRCPSNMGGCQLRGVTQTYGPGSNIECAVAKVSFSAQQLQLPS